MTGLLMLAGVLFVILVFVVTLVWALNHVDHEKERSPEDQLAGRFARGEMSEAEYLRNLAILQHGTQLVLEAERSPAEPRPGDS